MKSTRDELDEQMKSLLDRLRTDSPLSPQAAADERAKFLAQGEKYRAAVSPQPGRRHNGWINTLVFAFRRKERIPMLNTLLIVVMAVGFVFGGAGITVYAAQDSLPDEALYGVKTWSEDARLSRADSAQEQLDLTLGFTQRRVLEITELQAVGKPVPAGAITRLQEELNMALQLAAGMDDPQMAQALEQIRLQAETQSQTMAALASSAVGQSSSDLERLQERLREQTQLASAGQADPQGFRLQVRDRDRASQATPAPTGSTPLDSGVETPVDTPTPNGNSYGPGPGAGGLASETPGQYGPGEPNPSQTPQPTSGSYGPGPGAGQPTSTPGGYGPGPQAGTSTCTPAQNGGGPGSGANPSQTPQSGGPGSGSQNPSATSQSSGPGPGAGQATATPQQGGNSGSGQPTTSPGQGGRP